MVKKNTQIILTQNIEKLGKQGEIKSVSQGYAYNYLLPRNLAIVATNDKLKQLEVSKQKKQHKKRQELTVIEKISQRLSGVRLELTKKASDVGKLFEGVGADEVVNLLKQQKNIDLDKKYIKLDKKIKDIGNHKIDIVLGNKKTNIDLKIKSE